MKTYAKETIWVSKFLSFHSPILLYHFPLWQHDGVWGVYGEIWHLDRWLSHRLMSISTCSDNWDSLTMNISMSKHKDSAQTQSQQWWRAIRQADSLSYMGKHKHQYSATEWAKCFASVAMHKMRAHGKDNLKQWILAYSRSELTSQMFLFP